MALSHTRATLGLTQPANSEPLKISFAVKDVDVLEWKGDLLAVGVTEKDMNKDGDMKFENSILKKLDSQLGGLLAEAFLEEDFTGKAGQSTVLRLPGLGFKRIGLVGLGAQFSVAACCGLGEAVAVAAKAAQACNIAVLLASCQGLSAESKLNTVSAIASGTILGIHEDNRFKTEAKKSPLKSLDFIGFGVGPDLERKLRYVEDVCSGVVFGRELVNAPANVLTPGVLAEEASKIASMYNDVLSAKILNAEECKELKMGSYLGVAAASTNPPHFIHLCYKPVSGPVKAKLALVGKGLTFDSGGYNIKTGPGCAIELMKFDMGGSAAVLGAAKAIGQIKPACVEVHFIVAACENMISGTGMRPGDIVTASNGKTIEVNNTDAEGRLTLADALVYACNQGVEKIIDLATLTGACRVALGPSIAGVFTPNDALANEVLVASEVTGEKLWRMPLEDGYWESMKSGVADMVNTGGRQGGAITAALFLKQEWILLPLCLLLLSCGVSIKIQKILQRLSMITLTGTSNCFASCISKTEILVISILIKEEPLSLTNVWSLCHWVVEAEKKMEKMNRVRSEDFGDGEDELGEGHGLPTMEKMNFGKEQGLPEMEKMKFCNGEDEWEGGMV